MTSPAVLSEARETTRRVARTFSIATRMLPGPMRDDVYLLYLVFRTLDDLVDCGHPEAAIRVAAVEAWCDGGRPTSREAALLEELAARHEVSRQAMRDFCAGMRQDIVGAALFTEADVDEYCYRVAGTVGLVMAGLLGTRGDPAEASAAARALGMAMQRTNIVRDIDEDLANARVYLARETIDAYGGSLAPGDRAALVRDQIARADALYEEGLTGIPLLRNGGRAVAAAAAMYREILRQIEREGFGAQPGRAMVRRRRKLRVAASAYAMPPS